ncbi:glucuronylhydrolase [Candidatus Latescibacterota bacterium]
MKKVLCASIVLFSTLFMLSCAQSEQEQAVEQTGGIPVDEIFEYAAGQLTKAVAQVQDAEAFPFYTNKETGVWETQDDSWWASGFFAGCLWLMYEHTGDELWKTHAVKWTESMDNQLSNKSDADIGYRIINSYGNAYRLTKEEKYRVGLIEAAGSLASRYNEKVGVVKAYDMEQWQLPILIDHMMNIELMFIGANIGGDAVWTAMAEKHSVNTKRTCIREDGSSIQVVDLDPNTGEVIAHDTLCGLSGDSAWSRGQGEGVYGFAIAYRETKNPDFLNAAKVLADYFLANLPGDKIAYWDMKDPAIPNVIRDASASSMTADGLLEMCSLMPSGAERDRYYNAAVEILESLWENYSTRGTNSLGIIDHASFQSKDVMGADTALVFGDYNFLSALMKYQRMQ